MRASVLRQKTPTPSSPDELNLLLLKLRSHFSALMNYFVVFGAPWCGGVVVVEVGLVGVFLFLPGEGILREEQGGGV